VAFLIGLLKAYLNLIYATLSHPTTVEVVKSLCLYMSVYFVRMVIILEV